jgi:hypothetical protein
MMRSSLILILSLHSQILERFRPGKRVFFLLHDVPVGLRLLPPLEQAQSHGFEFQSTHSLN